MTKIGKKSTLFAASALCLTGTNTVAEDAQTQAELDALRAKVEALEADRAGPANGDFRIGNTTLDVYGYVKADFFYDFEFDQGDTAFVDVIGEPSVATDGTFGASIRQSRIGLRTSTPSGIGEIGGQLELDLFASNGTAELRLRHANITIGDIWLIGQYCTNFQPLDTYPNSVGFNGPVGIAYGREDYDLATSTGTLAFTELETIHVNAFYKATDNLTLSAEYIYGERNDVNSGQDFDGNRIQVAAQLNF